MDEQEKSEAEVLLAMADADSADTALEQEALFSVSRMADVLETGNDTKKQGVLYEMQSLLDHCFEDTLKILVPVLCLYVHEWNHELQLVAAESLLEVVHKKIPADVAKMISAASFRVVKSATIDTIYESWGEILVAVLPSVSWSEEEMTRVLALVDAHANRTSEVSRKLAARVYGALSLSLAPDKVNDLILSRTLKLCNDPDVEVRGMSTESLAFLGSMVPSSILRNVLWPELSKLMEDQNARIRAAALRSVARVLESERNSGTDTSVLAELLCPVFLQHCYFAESAAAEDQRLVDDDSYLLLEIFSEIFGELLLAASPFMQDDAAWVDAQKSFVGMSTCNGPVVRRHCAYNLPGVSQVIGARERVELTTVLEFLSRDPDPETRWNLAAGVHDSIRYLLDDETCEMLLKGFVSVLHDDNPLVRMNAVSHLSDGIHIFVEGVAGFSAETQLTSLFQNMSLLTEGSWRTQEILAIQLKECAYITPSGILKTSVLPILYRMAEESTHLVRRACMDCVAQVLFYVDPEEQEELANLFRIEWAQGGVFWMRNAYLDGVFFASKLFSKERFVHLFARYSLKLYLDPVSNVRMRLASIMRDLAYACSDMKEYTSALRMLKDDEDEDVCHIMEGIDVYIENLKKDTKDLDEEDNRRRHKEQSLAKKSPRKATSGEKLIEQKRASNVSSKPSRVTSPSAIAPVNSLAGASPASPMLKGKNSPTTDTGMVNSKLNTAGDFDAASAEVQSNHSNLSSAVRAKPEGKKPSGFKKFLAAFKRK